MTKIPVHRSDMRYKASHLNRCSIAEDLEVFICSDGPFCLVSPHSVASKCFDSLVLTYLLTYSLTYSMAQSRS